MSGTGVDGPAKDSGASFANPRPKPPLTWLEIYCARQRCTATQFHRRIFRLGLHRHALVFAPLLRLGSHFESDDELVVACGRARSLQEVHDAVESFRYHPKNRSWLRRQAALRISIRRLYRLAECDLAGTPKVRPKI